MPKAKVTERLKSLYRFIRYRNQRRKVRQERKIRKQQDLRLSAHAPVSSKKLIVFLVPGADWHTGQDKISGGILSIASLYDETKRLKTVHGADTIMMTHPGEYLLLKHSKFKNDIPVYRYEQLFSKFPQLEELMLHIPEYLVPYFLQPALNPFLSRLKSFKHVHINILNQNIRLMPSPEIVEQLTSIGHTVTQTTAHERYSSQEIRNRYRIPLHKFSVFGGPQRYQRKRPETKLNRIILSPDERAYKNRLRDLLLNAFPHIEQVEIRNMAYETYLQTIADSRYALTFGEGLDFYFLETVFSGGVGFALFNQDFFPAHWEQLPGIFSSEAALEEKLIPFIQALEKDMELYRQVQQQQYEAAAALYDYSAYQKNIKKFYCGEYTFA